MKVPIAGLSMLFMGWRYLAVGEKYCNVNLGAFILSYSKASWKISIPANSGNNFWVIYDLIEVSSKYFSMYGNCLIHQYKIYTNKNQCCTFDNIFLLDFFVKRVIHTYQNRSVIVVMFYTSIFRSVRLIDLHSLVILKLI